MQSDISSLNLPQIYAEVKFWSVVLGAFFGFHKGLKWLDGLKGSLTKIDQKLTSQTDSIVKELGELRNDIRAMTIARPMRASGRKKKLDTPPQE